MTVEGSCFRLLPSKFLRMSSRVVQESLLAISRSSKFIVFGRGDRRVLKRVAVVLLVCSVGFGGWTLANRAKSDAADMTDLVSVEFEVFGKVQGVFFRKYTQEKARSLNLTGWCRNTRKGTVEGVVEGPHGKVENMKHWLRYDGSPSSKISDAVFKNEEPIQQSKYHEFAIKR